jgi:hypothetical protein
LFGAGLHGICFAMMVRSLIMLAVPLFSLVLGCSDSASDSSGTSGASAGSDCLASSIELTETALTDSQSALLLDFDAQNRSTRAYDIQAGSTPIQLDFVVTTSDGSKYESTAPLTAAKISAGATAAVVAKADYGAGKTYKSYTVAVVCR